MYDVRGTHVVPGMTEDQKRKARRWELPATCVALLIIPYLILRESGLGGALPTLLEVANYGIWLFFIVEAVRMLQLAPDNRAWARHNIVDIAVIVAATPFLFTEAQWVQAFMLIRVLDLLPVVNRRLFRITTFKFAIVLLLLVDLGAAIAFIDIETPEAGGTYSLLEGLYWANTTVTTVGYGDISATTELGQIISMPIQAMGLVIGAILVAAVIPWFDREFAEGFQERVERTVSKATGGDGGGDDHPISQPRADEDLSDEREEDEQAGRRPLDLSGYAILDQMAQDQREIIRRLDELGNGGSAPGEREPADRA